MIADLVYEITATTGTGPFVPGGARSVEFRTIQAAHATGSRVYYCCRGGAQWEVGRGTWNGTTLERTEVFNGSSGLGVAVNFASGNKELYETLNSGAFLDVGGVPASNSFDDNDKVLVLKANGSLQTILGSVIKSSIGSTTPGDTTAPTITGASVANATPTVVALAVSEALNAAFTPAASAFTVSGHTVTGVSISGSTINLTVSAAFVNGEAARTAAYTQPGSNDARDNAGYLLASFTGRAITNNVAAAGSTVTGVTVSPSTANVAGSATQQFNATVAGTNSPSQGVNWTASAGTINSSGLFAAPAATSSAQTVTITATSQQDGTKSGTATVTVAAATTTPTMASTYTATPGVNFPTSSGYEGGSAPNRYWAQLVNVYIKDGANYPQQSPQIRCCWGKSATTPPITFSNGSWPGEVPFAANGGNSGNVPNSTQGLQYLDQNGYPGLFSVQGTVYGGGSPGNYYFWVLYPDGSSEAVQNPVAVS